MDELGHFPDGDDLDPSSVDPLSELNSLDLRHLDCLLRINTSKGSGEESMGDGEEGWVNHCPVSWDQVLCWPLTPAGDMAVLPCMDELQGIFYDTSYNVTRWCHENGTWEEKSHYDDCREIISESTSEMKEDIHPYFFGGFSISLIALALAIWIFLYFKDLRCLRNKIHTNLMVTYIFFDATWIFNTCVQEKLNFESCAVLTGMIHYFYLTNFFWMFVEGLYLFMLVVMTFTGEKIKLRVYLVVGWGIPAIFVVTWVITKHFTHVQDVDEYVSLNTTSLSEDLLAQYCPWMTAHYVDWLHKAPVIVVLCINMVFLLSIMWVLITKLRSSKTAETQQYKKATKAMVVLFPLLGITYILIMQGPKDGAVGVVFLKVRALLVGSQGFTVAMFYCFCNTEVQNTLRHRWERWRESRVVGGSQRYRLSRDWSRRSRTESIRLCEVNSGGGYRKRESTASASTTTTLLGSNGRLALTNGVAACTAVAVATPTSVTAPPVHVVRLANTPLLENSPYEELV